MKGKSKYMNIDGEFDGVKAYGAVLGTFLVCSWVEVILGFIRPKVSAVKDTCLVCRWVLDVSVPHCPSMQTTKERQIDAGVDGGGNSAHALWPCPALDAGSHERSS